VYINFSVALCVAQRPGLANASPRATRDGKLLVKMVKANGLVGKDFGSS